MCTLYRPESCQTKIDDHSLLVYHDSTLKLTYMYSHGKSIIIARHFNIHSETWLNSTNTTATALYAEEACGARGLCQYVEGAVRGENVRRENKHTQLMFLLPATTIPQTKPSLLSGRNSNTVLLTTHCAGQPLTVHVVLAIQVEFWSSETAR